MFPKSMIAALAATTLLTTSGCATLLAGGASQVDIAVDRPAENAVIVVRGINNDDLVTKAAQSYKATLQRNSPYAVAVSADGYEPQVLPVKLEVNPSYWLNLVPAVAAIALTASPEATRSYSPAITGLYLTFLGGVLVDAFTGNANRHAAVKLDVRLNRAEPVPVK